MCHAMLAALSGMRLMPVLGDVVHAILEAPEAIADWLRPKYQRPRKVTVPQFKGLLASQAFLAAQQAGVRGQDGATRRTARPG
jgi:hypothetical protein